MALKSSFIQREEGFFIKSDALNKKLVHENSQLAFIEILDELNPFDKFEIHAIIIWQSQ